jgi:GxxExxY protein
MELRDRGRTVARELRVPAEYKGRQIGWQRLDIVVDHRLVVDVKATEILRSHARRQRLSSLTATQLEVGLLLHVGPKPHFHRLIQSNERCSAATMYPRGPRGPRYCSSTG